jgi:ligand-binding sensor domain-containing protein
MPTARRAPEERGVVWASLVALLLATPVAGLDPGTTLTQYGHTAWRVRDGYFAGPPGSITQTKDGFLWIGTDTGLIRFDGVKLQPWLPPAGSALPTAWHAGMTASSWCMPAWGASALFELSVPAEIAFHRKPAVSPLGWLNRFVPGSEREK